MYAHYCGTTKALKRRSILDKHWMARCKSNGFITFTGGIEALEGMRGCLDVAVTMLIVTHSAIIL